MKERLQKIISAAGYASRRAGEELIKAGRVTVNGATANLGDSADTETDLICVDGKPLSVTAEKTYIMLNKPRGYVTTLSDEKGRRCVTELVKDTGKRLYPVGRLDMYSEGLLIMTDDGEFANRLMHPKYLAEKCYHAWVAGRCPDEALTVLSGPMEIDGYMISKPEVNIIFECDEYTQIAVTIHEGRNRQVRKMCEKAGLKLTRLMRVSEGGLHLGELKSGKWRYLDKSELQEIFGND